MKMIYKILAISFLLGMGLTSQAQSDRDQMEVQVDGLGCPFCAYGLEKKFKEFKGIKNVKIDMETGIFTFSYPASKELTLKQIEDQVDNAGYTAVTTKITRTDGTVEESKAIGTVLTDESVVIEQSFFVAGNCGMCKARIEKAAKKILGVVDAEWDQDTKEITVSFDTAQTTIGDIEANIVTAGHDTKKTSADDAVYEDLPGCCKYDRVNN